MLAIFKRDVRSYFYSPIAYVLIGLFVLIASFFFLIINIGYQTADFNGVLSTMGFILMFLVPVLTMRTLAEDRKNGTEVLLITSPISLSRIVIGKYLATLFVFTVMTCITFIYPIILAIFGKPDMPLLIGGYIGFFLLGAAFISVGVFASALTENQVVSAVIGFVSLLIFWLIEPIGNSIGGVASRALNWLSLLARYDDFSSGVFQLRHAVFYLSFISVFLFLAIMVIQKRRWNQG